RKQIDMANSFLRTPQTSLTLNGSVSSRSALQLSLQANDLHELETLAAAIRPGQPTIGLYGTASLHATVTGTTEAPKIDSQFNASNLKAKGTAWRQLRANINLDPSQINLQNGELEPVNRGPAIPGIGHGSGCDFNAWLPTKSDGERQDHAHQRKGPGRSRQVTYLAAPRHGRCAGRRPRCADPGRGRHCQGHSAPQAEVLRSASS